MYTPPTFPFYSTVIQLHLSDKSPALEEEAHCPPSLHLHKDCRACILSNWCYKIRGLQPSSDHSAVSSFFV